MDEKDITSNEEVDESCFIVETQAEVIEINESQDDLEVEQFGNNDESANEELEIENETMGEYQVIDETGCTSNPEDTVTENGHRNSTSEDPVSC